jgi:hypothetical protein
MLVRSLLCVALSSAVCDAAPIIYQLATYEMRLISDFVSNPDAVVREFTTEPYSVSGFIQTDGTLGELQAVNIVDFEINVVGPKPYQLTPETVHGNFPVEMYTKGATFADATDLYVDLGTDRKFKGLTISAGNIGERIGFSWSASPAFESWSRQQPPHVTAQASQRDHVEHYDFHAALQVADSTRITVGTVPEPSAFMLFGGFGLSLLNWRRGR